MPCLLAMNSLYKVLPMYPLGLVLMSNGVLGEQVAAPSYGLVTCMN